MAQIINIAGAQAIDDPEYRYKMPRIIGKVEGRGNGIKTAIPNMVDVASSLHRPPGEVTKFFGCELGAQTTYNDDTERSIVNGAHETRVLQDKLSVYIEKFVLCPACKLPETSYKIKHEIIYHNCLACGAREPCDMQHKLTTYILKQHKIEKKAKAKDKAKKDKDGKDGKKDKKSKKDKDGDDDKKKKEKKDKKDKKKKKKRARNAGACDQDQFGSRGVVRESDFFRKRREFEAWLGEVKQMPGFSGSKREQLELFREYAEDFNTCTLPSDKYYDLEAWEQAEYARKLRGERSSTKERTVFDDERDLERERRAEAEKRDRAAEQAELRDRARDGDRMKDVREADLLRAEQQHAYKRGDQDAVRRIQRKLDALAPEKADAGPKHPWG
mmetsp:Transcript_20439/g.53239  ORF Transcript_20439/g.53239 Transcript_20439/m.53239 type:complete len:386 (-) Transcript_20439:30-1187(-)